MNEPVKGPSYLMRWDHSRHQRLGRDVVRTTHRLAELPIFSDEGLAELLDQHPRKALHVSTMGDNPAHANQLRIGQLGDHSGADLVAMIQRGRLCLRLRNVVQHHEKLRRIVDRLDGEMKECQPGLRTGHHEGDLEISSPVAQTYFRCDLEPNIFWQIRGCRSIWVYPSVEPFVQTRALEEMVAGRSGKPLYFEPAFDDHARRLVQTAGDTVSLPQQTPYRVVNDQHLTVTLTTNYVTRASRRRNETHRANYALKRFLPLALQADGRYGLRATVKRTIIRVTGRRRIETPGLSMTPTFCVDPEAPFCVGPLNTETCESSTVQSKFPELGIPTATSPTAASES